MNGLDGEDYCRCPGCGKCDAAEKLAKRDMQIAALKRGRDAAKTRIAKLEAALAERTKERDAANGEEK